MNFIYYLLPITGLLEIAWSASPNDAGSSERESYEGLGYDEGNDLLFEPNDVGRDTGNDFLGGGFSDQTTHASSFSSANLSLNEQGGNLHIPPEVVPGDDSRSGQDEVASPNDDANAGLDDGDLVQYLSEGAEYYEFAATGTPNSISANQNSISINNSISSDNTVSSDDTVNNDRANFGVDHSELSICHEEVSQIPDSGNPVRDTSVESDPFADEQGFDMPFASQLPSNGVEVGSSPEQLGTNTQNPLEISDNDVEDGFNDPHMPGSPADKNYPSTTATRPTSRTFDFHNTEAPVYVSHVEVELVVPAPRKAIIPVVALCCYIGGGPTPNVLDEKCVEKGRVQRARRAAAAAAEANGGQSDAQQDDMTNGEASLADEGHREAQVGAAGLDAPSTVSQNKRGASTMAGNEDVGDWRPQARWHTCSGIISCLWSRRDVIGVSCEIDDPTEVEDDEDFW
ncbi:hypothetical protein B0H65DRAFT_446871 [Neurospora tetraspora]|uniref:Uncharacterized protein n=1 Tax=Neurospora tetraspora TaxID=94610 RepID=A0AAE0J099_9PEZI|nr:hypothetical protein B0H65DRAFT_446871 [Neurospora tetraspora]